jgi:hypothetical protein
MTDASKEHGTHLLSHLLDEHVPVEVDAGTVILLTLRGDSQRATGREGRI